MQCSSMLHEAPQHRRSLDSAVGEQSTTEFATEFIPDDEFWALDAAIRAAEAGSGRMLPGGSHSAPGSMRTALSATAQVLRIGSRAAASAGAKQQPQHARTHGHLGLVLPPPEAHLPSRAHTVGAPRAVWHSCHAEANAEAVAQQRRAASGHATVGHHPAASTAGDAPRTAHRTVPGFAAPARLPETAAAAAAARQRSLQRSWSQPERGAVRDSPATPAATQPPVSSIKQETGDPIAIQETQPSSSRNQELATAGEESSESGAGSGEAPAPKRTCTTGALSSGAQLPIES